MALSKDRLAELLAKSKMRQAASQAVDSIIEKPVTNPLNKALPVVAGPVVAGIIPNPVLVAKPQPAPAILLNPVKQGAEILAGLGGNKLSDADLLASIKADSFVWNAEQQMAIDMALLGESFCLIGAAGTGKTTVTKQIVTDLIASGSVPPLSSDTKYLNAGSPGVVAVSFTRRAVANIRKAMPADMKNNCITIHKLLEYAPIFYEVFDPITGDMKNTMRFEPQRNAYNPLPTSIHTIIVDESSMVSVELFEQMVAALRHKVQWIFLGDIQQLPPVMGSAILGYKLIELPTVQLEEVYRQALESPIIRLAHHILQGKTIAKEDIPSWEVKGKLKIHPWKKRLDSFHALRTAQAFFRQAIDTGAYQPDTDIILIPFNKEFGCIELNLAIADHLGKQRGAEIYEVIAGFSKYYLAVGDKVLYDKEDAVIKSISRNASYLGKRPQKPSTTLDRWGHEHVANHGEYAEEDSKFDLDNIDFLLEQAQKQEERVLAASHIITLEMCENGDEVVLDQAAEVNNMLLGYALTVHKSQGSEWRKVFCVFHQSHNTMMQRELLYTAVTRAKEELYVICEPDHFVKAIESQKIKGTSLAEKAEYFKGLKERRNKEKSNKDSEEDDC